MTLATQAQTAAPRTVEDYLALTDTRGWELDGGCLMEKNVGTKSSWIGSLILMLIGNFARERKLGLAFHADTAYRCFPRGANIIRKPDVSFIGKERFTDEQLAAPFITIPPDLAVEVISPNDLATEVDAKVREYLEAGVRLVWVVNPEVRTIRIHRADGTISQLDERGQITGEDVLPGFQLAVKDLFQSAHAS